MSDPHQLSHSAEHAAVDAEAAAHDPVAHAHVNYWAIFGALCALTAVSWIADEMKGTMGAVLLVLVVLTVASFKAMFVMLYFMHLKFEGKWKFVLLAPTTVLALAIIAALMPDIGSHYYDVQVPQIKEAAAQAAHSGAEGHETPKPPHH
ncbi:MAG TPA: cytochrome C oxidase subunit IV family protein [Planctomycetaceae bacterium]|nr:cytochrome C oxidase subunit IV family protein [Planctomycetaceae bacterium]